VRDRALRLEAHIGEERLREAARNAPPSEKARLYPRAAQATPTKPSEATLIIIVLRAFFERTRPP